VRALRVNGRCEGSCVLGILITDCFVYTLHCKVTGEMKGNDVTPLQETFITIFGGGATLSALLAFIAGRLSGWLFPLLLFGLSVLCFWISLFLGLDLGYRAWQAMPNPPDAAYSDSSPSGAMIAGWIPGVGYVSFWFGLSWLIRLFVWKPKVLQGIVVEQSEHAGALSTALETGNAYQPPKT
jgi:hypothetical protein